MVGLAVVLAVGACCVGFISVGAQEVCGGKPADVMFVLDSSASITKPNFEKQIKFTQDVVRLFDIGQNRTRVGVILFSTTVFPKFGLNHYSDKGALAEAIGQIEYSPGGTHTAEAIDYIRYKVFKNSGRKGVPKIAITLTDGQSYDMQKTKDEARAAHTEGIAMFVIGIGNDVNMEELQAIASDPDSEYLLRSDSYSALAQIKTKLAIKACKVKYVKQKMHKEEPWLSGVNVCTLNLIFGVDTTGVSTTNTRRTLSFMSDLSEQISSGIEKVRTSQIMTGCPEGILGEGKSYAPLIRKMRYQVPRQMYSSKSPYMKASGILLVDSPVMDTSAASSEIQRSKFISFEIYIVAIGWSVDDKELARMFRTNVQSDTFRRRVFRAGSHRDLNNLLNFLSKFLIASNTCQ